MTSVSKKQERCNDYPDANIFQWIDSLPEDENGSKDRDDQGNPHNAHTE